MRSTTQVAHAVLLAVLLALLLLGLLVPVAGGYTLLAPNHKWGDPDQAVEYRLNTTRNEGSIPGDAEFDDLRTSFQVWTDVGTRMAFREGPNHTYCDFNEDGYNEVAFDDCGGQCTGNCLAVTRSVTDASVDIMWQEGPDGTIKPRAKYDADILFNASTNLWSPSEGNCLGNQFSVIGIAVHEIGHVLGLGHSSDPSATMEATIAPCSRIEETLAADDIAGLQQLYSTASEEYVVRDFVNGAIAVSVNNAGNFGHTSQGGRWGRGFEAPVGVANLYESALALGTPSGANLSDDFRMQGPTGQDADFVQQTGISLLNAPAPDPFQFSTCHYNDSGAESPYGVRVTQRSFVFPAGTDEQYLIMQYRITNQSGAALNDLNVGIFMDWDVQGLYANNTCSYDADLGLGWVSDPGTARQCGICVLNPEGAVTYSALYATNNDTGEIYTEANKKSWFFSGFTRTEIVNNDIAMLIATGPFDVAPGGTVTAAFAIIAGADHADLRAQCGRARGRYEQVRVFPDSPASVADIPVAARTMLAQNRPNPFRADTRIAFTLGAPNEVQLDVYDTGGRHIRNLLSQELAADEYEVIWDGRDDDGQRVPSGLYLYRLRTPGASQEKKLLLLP
jgi:hypothetical protein